MQIPSFPDILSLLKPAGAGPGTADPAGEQQSQPSQDHRPVDTLSLSSSPFGDSVASLERLLDQAFSPAGGHSGGLTLSPDGTYAPGAGVSRSASTTLSLEFNLNIRRETTQDSVQRLGADPGQAAVHVREATGIAYRSSAVASRSNIGGTFVESRKVQAELFYSRTREMSVRLDPAAAQDFGSASSSVGRTFELDIELGVSFLGQFINQTEGIQSLDTSLLTQYLQSADGLAGPSGTNLQAFFDDVGRILEGTEQFMADALGTFLQQVSGTFGLTQGETDALQQLVSEQVSGFFDEIDAFLEDARTALAGLEQGDTPSLPEAAPQPTAELLAAPVPPPIPEPEPEPTDGPTETDDLVGVDMA